MTLIACPECSHEVSDQAASCPKCGYPLQPAASPPSNDLDGLLKQTLARDGKMAAIKLYRACNPSVGLVDAKQHVEQLERLLPPGSVKRRGCAAAVVLGGFFIAACAAAAIWGALT